MTASGVPTLADDKRQATVTRILRSARLFLAEHGLDVTVEEIAEAAGVSRRTLFRYFPTRDQLVAAAIGAGLERYGQLLPAYHGTRAALASGNWLPGTACHPSCRPSRRSAGEADGR